MVLDPKDLEKLPKEITQRILEKIEAVQEDPLRYAERLVDVKGYKIRVGDYRILFSLTHNPNKMRIGAVKHRREAYQKK